jgi:hypothetical protein
MLENDGPHFQDCAFDPELGTSWLHKRGKGELRKTIDGRELGPTGVGFQIKNIRTEKRDVPEWARTNEGIQKLLLTAFPKLKINDSQRKRAGRWAQVIQMYFRMGWTYSEVADALEEKPRVIEMVIRGITRTSEGKTWSGAPRKRIAP